MIVDEPARIRYYMGRAMQFESPEHSGAPAAWSRQLKVADVNRLIA
jgi:hypothetical protein